MLCEILDITQSRKLEGSFVLEKNLGRVRLVFFPLYRIVLTHDFKCIIEGAEQMSNEDF